MVRKVAHVLDGPVIEELPRFFAEADTPKFFAQPNVVRKLLLELMPLGIAVRTVHRPLRNRVRLGLIQQVSDPGRDRLDNHLRPFTLQKVEHVEVAVAFGNLRPELARDLYHRPHLGAVHFDLVHALAGGVQGFEIVLAPQVFVHLAQHIKCVAQDFIVLHLRLEPVRTALLDLE